MLTMAHRSHLGFTNSFFAIGYCISIPMEEEAGRSTIQVLQQLAFAGN